MATRRLDPRTWSPVVDRYLQAREGQAAAEALARAAKKDAEGAMAAIVEAMGDADVATVGNRTVAIEDGKAVPASVTVDGAGRVPWQDIGTLTLRTGVRVPAERVTTIFGGRAGGRKLVVSGGDVDRRAAC